MGVLLGIPTYSDKLPVSTASALICMEKPGQVEFAVISRSRIDQSRNLLLKYAYEKGLGHVLFVDDDNPPPINAMSKLLSRGKDIIGCLIPKRKPGYEYCIFDKHFVDGKFKAYRHKIDLPEEEVFEVDAIGCGVTLVKMEAVKKIIKRFNKGWKDGDKWDDIKVKPFDFVMFEGDLIGEDIAFCQRAQEAGVKIHCDQTLRVPHIGESKVIRIAENNHIEII